MVVHEANVRRNRKQQESGTGGIIEMKRGGIASYSRNTFNNITALNEIRTEETRTRYNINQSESGTGRMPMHEIVKDGCYAVRGVCIGVGELRLV